MVDSDFFSNNAKRLGPSAIREILKYASDLNVISLGGGLPSPETFPEKVMIDKKAFQYNRTDGVPEFKRNLVNYLRNHGISTKEENILIVSGSQQGLFLIPWILIDKEDVIVVEDPTYLAATKAFSNPWEPTIVGIDLESNGINVDSLEEMLKRKKPKFLYTIPTFQNPTGITMDKEKRKRLIELADEYDFLIVEDDPYGMIRFSGDPIPSIKSMDKNDRVIYLGTFSKTFAPGFRIGYVVGDKEIIRKMEIAKQGVDLCTEVPGQYIISDYLEKIDQHVRDEVIPIYKNKRDVMLDELEDRLSGYAEWTHPDGGMFLWLETKVNTDEMFNLALRNGVLYVPGHHFFIKKRYNCMRLNFSYPTVEEIKEGIRRLEKTIKSFGKNS